MSLVIKIAFGILLPVTFIDIMESLHMSALAAAFGHVLLKIEVLIVYLSTQRARSRSHPRQQFARVHIQYVVYKSEDY